MHGVQGMGAGGFGNGDLAGYAWRAELRTKLVVLPKRLGKNSWLQV
jgi:hypothetical protein